MNSGVDILFFPEDPGRTDNQRIQRIDNPADAVGKPSGRIGRVGALFENDDFPVRFLPANLGCGAHAGGMAADYSQSFLGHQNLCGSRFRVSFF
jgi:hypothetical protein